MIPILVGISDFPNPLKESNFSILLRSDTVGPDYLVDFPVKRSNTNKSCEKTMNWIREWNRRMGCQ